MGIAKNLNSCIKAKGTEVLADADKFYGKIMGSSRFELEISAVSRRLGLRFKNRAQNKRFW
jgi:hypothetical protein